MDAKGKFRGVPYWVRDVANEGGRRNVVHERPGADQAFAEDLGRATRRFTIECFTIGASFRADADKLVSALEKPGPGPLEHPTRGKCNVAVDGTYKERETTDEGGMVRFTIQFVETGTQAGPRVSLDPGFSAKSKSLSIKSAMTLATLDTSGPDFLTKAVRAILAGPDGLTNALAKINNGITAKLNLIDTISRAVDDFSAELTSLINTPASLALRVQNLINSALTAIGTADRLLSRGDKQSNVLRVGLAVGALGSLGNFGDAHAEPTATTSSRSKQRGNRNALVDLVEVAALADTVSALIDIPLDNLDQADSVLDDVGGVFDRILERETADEDTMQSLRDLRALYYAHMRRQAIDLSGLGHFTPVITRPALSIAFQLWADSTLDTELVDRNLTIEHPGFVQGAVELAVPNV